MCRVKVPATTANIGPGFDCLGVALNLYNYIDMDFSTRPNVEVFGEGRNHIAKDETNLVYRAARRVLEVVGDNRPLSITLDNNIPIARGLGSSAACIAGGMMAANRLIGDFIPLKKLMQMVVEMEGHPDNVVPAIIGGFCVSIVSNNRIIYRKIKSAKNLKFVVGIPDFHLKTEAARSALPRTVSLKDAVFNICRTAMLVASFCTEDMTEIDDCFKDRLHQPYRSPLVPGMEEIISCAHNKGAIGCFLSGAGPSVVAITDEQNAEELGGYICRVFDKNGVSAIYKVLSSCDEGVEYE